MSALAYGALTETRKKAQKGTSTTTQPGLGTFIDVLAALVPAEVLAAHAFILTLATESVTTTDGQSSVVITEERGLKWTFWILAVMSVALFVAGRWLKPNRKRFDWRWDLCRLAVPPLAFVGWTMIQKNTAFDAVFDWSGNERAIFAVLGAVVLGFAAGLLSVRADREDP